MLTLILLVTAGVLWFVYKPSWAPRPPDTHVASARVGRLYEDWRDKLLRNDDQKKLAQQLKAYLTTPEVLQSSAFAHLNDDAVRFIAWLKQLPDADLGLFTRKAAQFCADLNYDPAWLLDGQTIAPPEIKQAMEEAVILYGLSYWRASQLAYDSQALRAYQEWLESPHARSNRELGQRVYTQLVNHHLTNVPPSLYMAKEKQRQTHLEATLREVAQDNPMAFLGAVREALGLPPTLTAPLVSPANGATTPAPIDDAASKKGRVPHVNSAPASGV